MSSFAFGDGDIRPPRNVGQAFQWLCLFHHFDPTRASDPDDTGASVVIPFVEVPCCKEQPGGTVRGDKVLMIAMGIQSVTDEKGLLQLWAE